MKLLQIAAAAAIGISMISAPASAVVVVTKRVVRPGPARVFVPRRPVVVRPLVRPLVRRPALIVR